MEKKLRYPLKKARKIKRQKEISSLFTSVNRWSSASVTVYHTENKMNRNRCAIVIPKAAGTAVERNRKKRLVREWFRKNCAHTKHCLDILVKIRAPKRAVQDNRGLEKALTKWFESLNT